MNEKDSIVMVEHDPHCEGPDDQKLLDDVAEYGWHVLIILEKEETPGWAFSVGLYKNFNHPEIIVFGLNGDLMHSIINGIGEEVRAGKSFETDSLYPDLIEAYSCTFKPVNRVWYYHFLGYANWFYKGKDYPVLQCFWPDKNSRFPWEPSFNPNWVWAQPLLFNEDPESARTTELLQSMDDDWKFKDPKNQSVYTLRQIMDDSAPILHVSHNSDDGAWQFLGWETPNVEDGIVVCLEHIVEKDSSVIELADLPLGWHAWRESLTEPWTREVNPYDAESEHGSSIQ